MNLERAIKKGSGEIETEGVTGVKFPHDFAEGALREQGDDRVLRGPAVRRKKKRKWGQGTTREITTNVKKRWRNLKRLVVTAPPKRKWQLPGYKLDKESHGGGGVHG